METKKDHSELNPDKTNIKMTMHQFVMLVIFIVSVSSSIYKFVTLETRMDKRYGRQQTEIKELQEKIRILEDIHTAEEAKDEFYKRLINEGKIDP